MSLPDRRSRLLTGLRDRGLDGAVLVGSGHATHLTGYSRYYSGPVALVIDGDGGRTLVVPAYEVDAARAEADVDRVVPYGDTGFGLDLEAVGKLVTGTAALLSGGRIGVASEAPGVADAAVEAAGAEAVPVDDLVHDVRLLKDPDEVASIARAYRLALAGQAEVERLAVPGAREIDLFTAAHARAQAEAGRPVEFISDMLVDERSADVCCPVRVAGEDRLRAAGVVVSDVAVRHRGYWGDSARTYVAAGGSRGDVVEVRVALEAILAEAAAGLRPGARARDVFRRMDEAISERFADGAFPHHGGHGIGLTPFEDPHLIPADDSTLEEGMVLAVEPGVYFAARFGVRVENTYVVGPDGGIELREVAGDAG